MICAEYLKYKMKLIFLNELSAVILKCYVSTDQQVPGRLVWIFALTLVACLRDLPKYLENCCLFLCCGALIQHDVVESLFELASVGQDVMIWSGATVFITIE